MAGDNEERTDNHAYFCMYVYIRLSRFDPFLSYNT